MQYVDKKIEFKFSNNEHNKNIVLCGDKAYIKYVGITLTSICLNSDSKSWSFHIFLDDISEQDKQKIEKTARKFSVNISIYFINMSIIDKFSDDMGQNTHISKAAYFRLIAFGSLNNIQKALYLDSDICVIDNKIQNIWDVDLNGNVAAVIGKPKGDATEIRLKVGQAFNSGVMFIDIDRWKLLNLTNVCMEKALERVWPMLDQDVLNIVLDGKIISLPERYNYEYSLSLFIDSVSVPSKVIFPRDEATIIHYIGASKPWHTWVQCCDATKIYMDVKRKSFWKDENLANPDTMKNNVYKYWHKAARVARKEQKYCDMFYCYFMYSIRKLGFNK